MTQFLAIVMSDNPPDYVAMDLPELRDSLLQGIDPAAVKKFTQDIVVTCKQMQRRAGCQTCGSLSVALQSAMLLDAILSALEMMMQEDYGSS